MQEKNSIIKIKENILTLGLSQKSIEMISFQILEECHSNLKLVDEIILLWDSICESSEMKTNKLSLIYLANDIILRPMFENEYPFQNTLFRQLLLKNIPIIFNTLNSNHKEEIIKIIEIWKDYKIFGYDFYIQMKDSLPNSYFDKIRETNLSNLATKESEILIPNKILMILENILNFQEKREISRNSHKDFKEGKIDKCKYLNALNSENSIRKVILNLFSRDILQNKLLIHSRHVRLLSEIENFMESIDNLKKNLIN